MAIRLDYNFRGLTVVNSYVRIEHVAGGKFDGEGWTGSVKVYASKAAADAGLGPLERRNISAPYEDARPNPYIILYEALKAQTAFALGADV